MKKVLIWILAFIVLGALIAVGVSRRGSDAPARSIEEIHAAEGVPVDVVTVTADTVSVLREITGTVSGVRQSVLRASSDHKVASVLVKEGQQVKRGQTLLEYDTVVSPDRMARLAQVRESYDNAKRQVDRLEPLFEAGAISESELDAARTRMAIAAADLRSSQLEVEVVSPIDGVATLVAVRRGDAVEAGDVVAQVAVLDSIRVEADVAGSTAAEIGKNAPVMFADRFAPPGREGREVGYVARVALGGDPDSRLFRVEAVCDNAGARLRPGMTATLEVVVERVGPVPVIPPIALLGDESVEPGTTQHVFAVDGGVARRTAVEVGRMSEDLLEVRSGLDEGDRVVVFGANRLEDGTKVRFHKIDGKLQTATGPEEVGAR
jgi:membrane fusion protein (multidrug efflux system)